MSMARYFLQFGSRSVVLPTGALAIGRSDRCALQIDDPRVSREHAIVYSDEAGVRIRDKNSHNGVFVNGRRVAGVVPLECGDRVTIGPSEFQLREAGAAQDGATARVTETRGSESDSMARRLESLSHRERQVFELLAHGHPQRVIGERLGLSTKTVETYRARIGEKLNVRTRAEIVEIAVHTGVLAAPSHDIDA